MKFTKPPLSYQQQIALLQSRGLLVPDATHAEHYLKHISYYRLSAYALPFQQVKDTFNKGTTFDDLLNLYVFDRELRLLVFDAIERIEIAFRTQMIYQLSHKYGSHWQHDASIFDTKLNRNGATVFDDIQGVINKHCETNRPEVFIAHYLSKYNDPETPPSWMSIELLTIGELSRLYVALKNNNDKNDIANYFGLHYVLMESWLHAITYARNICAHHSRLWNREFAIQPFIPRKQPKLPWITFNITPNNSGRCFYFLCVLKYLLQTINPTGHFKQRLVDLIKQHPGVPIQFLGIPTDGKGSLINWAAEPLWK